jgi:chaperonin GroES
MAVKPLDDRVLIQQCKAEETTAGGIVLPDAAQEKPQMGTIVAAGPGKLLDSGARSELSVKVGDVVYYGKYAGMEVKIDSDEFIICRESDILAVVAK